MKLKFETMKHQVTKGVMNTSYMIGESIGESGRQVQRYIRLTYLHPEILKMVDSKKISFLPAVDISHLKMKEQELLLHTINDENLFPSGIQASKLKECSKKKSLTVDIINTIMPKKKSENIKLSIPSKKLKKYFPEEYSSQDIINAIIILLDEKLNKEGTF